MCVRSMAEYTVRASNAPPVGPLVMAFNVSSASRLLVSDNATIEKRIRSSACNIRAFSASPQVRKEISETVESAGGDLPADSIAAGKCLPLVDACVKEAQRLYPVAPFVVRRLSTDLRLKDGECDSVLLPRDEEGR